MLSPSSCRLLCWTCKATAFSSERLEKSCAAQVDSMSSSVCYVAVFSKLLLLLFVLIASVLIPSVAPNVFFPVETSRDLVQYRSLKDILFRSQSEDNDQQHSIQSPVVASFRPANPSPTLASSPHSGASVGVSKIRFLDADEFFVPNFSPVPHSEFIPPAAQTEGRRANLPILNPDHITTVVRQAKSPEINDSAIGTSVTGSPAQDRWPWPYSKPIKQAVNIQSRQQQSPSLIVKKSVAKPYRLLTRTSSCPKLLHDLTITCSWPKQQQLQRPVVNLNFPIIALNYLAIT